MVGQFDRFFKVQKSIIFERAIVNRHCQGQNKTVEQFITSLYSLAENCEYGELKDQTICDCIVVGMRDQSQSVHLQMDLELTLEKAKTLVRQCEAVQEQQSLFQHGPNVDKVIDSMHKTPLFKGKGSHREDAPLQLQGSHSQPKASVLAVAVDPIRVNSAQPMTLNATPAKRRGTIAHSTSTSQLLT